MKPRKRSSRPPNSSKTVGLRPKESATNAIFHKGLRHALPAVQIPRAEILVLLFVMAIACAMRLDCLPTIPPGLYPDEATNGNDAIQAWESGNFRLFYPNNSGREGLFINLQSITTHCFGNTAFALRLVSAIIGIFTVLGTYFLTRAMFKNWHLAAIAAFLIATGFWHVNFSRIGFRAILGPLMAVWGFYFLFRGTESHRFRHWALAGLFFGLGFHTYIAFRAMPIAILAVVTFYWINLRAENQEKYRHLRGQVLRHVATMFAVMLLVIAPLAVYFANHPDDFLGHTARRSVFNEEHPLAEIANNTLLELGMFVVQGDQNWRHNLPTSPVLFWPVGILFALGLVYDLWLFARSCWVNGAPPMPQALLLAWFCIGLLPAIVSNEGMPHALRSLLVAPAVYIIAAQALYWPYRHLTHNAAQKTGLQTTASVPGSSISTGDFAASAAARHLLGFAIVVCLAIFGILDARRYFHDWAQSPNTAAAFSIHSVELAYYLNELPPEQIKYVVTSPEDAKINGIGIAAQTVMFLTDTSTPQKQRARNIYYLTPEQFLAHQFPENAVLFQMP